MPNGAGVKPLVPYQHRFSNFYLFGSYSAPDGEAFTLELPYCNGVCFGEYLKQMSAHKPEEFKILILDNGAFHKGKDLEIPKNTGLLFLPPYSPELNGAEQIWRYLKDRLGNLVFKTLDALSEALAEIIKKITPQIIHPIVKNNYTQLIHETFRG